MRFLRSKLVHLTKQDVVEVPVEFADLCDEIQYELVNILKVYNSNIVTKSYSSGIIAENINIEGEDVSLYKYNTVTEFNYWDHINSAKEK